MGPNTSPRVREVMTALIRHMHDFAREVNLTTEEYLAACDFMVRAGHMSDDKRNEVVLLTDVFGLESLADFLTQGADSGRHAVRLRRGHLLRHSRPLLA